MLQSEDFRLKCENTIFMTQLIEQHTAHFLNYKVNRAASFVVPPQPPAPAVD